MPQFIVYKRGSETSLVVQWLRLCSSTVGASGSIRGLRTRILHAEWCAHTPPPPPKIKQNLAYKGGRHNRVIIRISKIMRVKPLALSLALMVHIVLVCAQSLSRV